MGWVIFQEASFDLPFISDAVVPRLLELLHLAFFVVAIDDFLKTESELIPFCYGCQWSSVGIDPKEKEKKLNPILEFEHFLIPIPEIFTFYFFLKKLGGQIGLKRKLRQIQRRIIS